MNNPIRCTTHFHACDCREYEFEKVKRQLEIQTKRVENLKDSLKRTIDMKTINDCVETVKLAWLHRAIDQELQKQLQEHNHE